MVWIKRNLFWVVFGLACLGLLGWGTFYLISNMGRLKESEGKIEEIKSNIDRYLNSPASPNDNNLAVAEQSRNALDQIAREALKHFAPVPYTNATDVAFKKLLDATVHELTNKAHLAHVQLPTKDYAFSFASQLPRTRFDPRAFPFLPEHLAEIKVICQTLFDAHVRRLVHVKRPYTMDDTAKPSPDCHDLPREVRPDSGMVVNFYEVSFLCFSSELAAAMNNLQASPFALMVKVFVVDQPAGDATSPPGMQPNFLPGTAPAGAPGLSPPRPNRGQPGPGRGNRNLPDGLRPPRLPPPPPGTAPAPASMQMAAQLAAGGGRTGPDGLRTVVDEKLFRVTLLIEVAKPIK